MRRRDEHRVIPDVGLQVGRLVVGPGHRLEHRLDRGQLVGRGALRGQSDGGRLDDLADLEHAPQELRVEAGFGEPAEHVGVEEAPLGARQDDRSALGAGFDQALGGQDLGRLPDDGPADAELAAQLALFREDLARGQLAADDPSPDALDDAGVDAGRSGLARGAFSTRGLYILLYDTIAHGAGGAPTSPPGAATGRQPGTGSELVQIWSLTPTVQIWFNRPHRVDSDRPRRRSLEVHRLVVPGAEHNPRTRVGDRARDGQTAAAAERARARPVSRGARA